MSYTSKLSNTVLGGGFDKYLEYGFNRAYSMTIFDTLQCNVYAICQVALSLNEFGNPWIDIVGILHILCAILGKSYYTGGTLILLGT